MNQFYELNKFCALRLYNGVGLFKASADLLVTTLRREGLKAKTWQVPGTAALVVLAIDVLGLDHLSMPVINPKDYPAVKCFYYAQGSVPFPPPHRDFDLYLPESLSSTQDFLRWFDHTLPDIKEQKEVLARGFYPESETLGWVAMMAARSYPKIISKYLPRGEQRDAARTQKIKVYVQRGDGYLESYIDTLIKGPAFIGPLDAFYQPTLELWVPKHPAYLPQDFKSALRAALVFKRFEALAAKKKSYGGSLWHSGTLISIYEGQQSWLS